MVDISNEGLEPDAARLRIEQVSKAYTANQPVLTDIGVSVEAGEIVCLLGPSGCGKTTLLRIVAGLEAADAGRVLYDGQDLQRVPVHAREFGFMFQDFALFPHKTVGENVAFGLRMEKRSRAQIQTRVAEMLDLVALDGYAERSVFELSGGERQRVALARSLAPSPGLLMLDEPLGALDRSLREELMIELRGILKELGVTALYVTHDQQEAFAVADRIVVMNEGRIEQDAPPQLVHDRPASAFVARFLGFQNLLPVQPASALRASAAPQIQTPLGVVEVNAIGARRADLHKSQLLLIRPEAARFVDGAPPAQGLLPLDCILEVMSYRGSYYRIGVQTVSAQNITIQNSAAAKASAWEPAAPIALSFDVPAYRLLADGRRRPLDPGTLQPGQRLQLALDPSLMTLL